MRVNIAKGYLAKVGDELVAYLFFTPEAYDEAEALLDGNPDTTIIVASVKGETVYEYKNPEENME